MSYIDLAKPKMQTAKNCKQAKKNEKNSAPPEGQAAKTAGMKRENANYYTTCVKLCRNNFNT